MMKVCICGGGNLGHVIAGYVAAKQDYEVCLLTRRPHLWSDLVIEKPDGSETRSQLSLVTDDPQQAVGDAGLVLLCLPGYSIRDVLLQIKDYLRPQTAVGSVVSSTGFFFQAMELLPADIPLFGLQRVPFISRVVEYGHRARLMGYKEELRLAVEHSSKGEELRGVIEQMLDTPTHLMGNFYEVSLSNSNPLLHPARLYDLWADYRQGDVYTRVPLFYEEWTERAAQLYMALDEELQQLLSVLPVAQGCVPKVLDYYESTDAASLARKLCSIEAFKGIKAPMKAVEGGYVPDFHSRYFAEDFPYGIAVVRQLAHQKGIATPTMDMCQQWWEELGIRS